MKFNLLRQEAIKEAVKIMPKIDNKEQLEKELSHYGKTYKGGYEAQRKKLFSFIIKRVLI